MTWAQKFGMWRKNIGERKREFIGNMKLSSACKEHKQRITMQRISRSMDLLF